ncbi:hypothetical protein DFJ74DRAFT_612018 [Hyaloraphidium curvatum]|nr:hypothetical protein DFJ74DRAFT_612018 [Hyaloraphidium curvatum]
MSTGRAKPVVLLTRTLTPNAQKKLESDQSVALVQSGSKDAMPRETLLKMLREHKPDGLLCMLTDKIDGEVLDAAGLLKVVSTVSVGYDHIVTSDLVARRIRLGNTPGVLTDATADLTVLLLLAVSRRFLTSARALYDGQWGAWDLQWNLGTGLAGKTVGIVGLGAIGTAVCQRLRPFIGSAARILYTGPSRKPDAEAAVPGGAQYFADLDEMLPEADIVIVLCSLNSSTKDLFTYDRFALMKPDALFVNSARGGIVKQADLVRALEEGMLGGVGLDVMVPEPLPKDDPLTKFDRVTLLPHIGSGTIETREAMANLAVENVIAGVHGRLMKAEVKLFQ